jgi:hypothetical protein
MNRWLTGGIALIVILIAGVYIFIPSHLVVTKIVLVNCNRDGADRVLGDTAGWIRWWPHTGSGVNYKISERLHHGATIAIDDGGTDISSELNIFPLSRIDSSYLQWQFIRETSLDPLNRFRQYREAVKLNADMAVILDSLQRYLNDPKNVYGIRVLQASTKDSFLVETRHIMRSYPGTGDIYDLVKKLDLFVTRRGGVRTGYPMVNVDSQPDGQLILQTAIPVNIECRDSGDIVSRKLVKGNYLESDISGGPATIKEALNRMRDYIADNKRTTMAIPFFSLITDRERETDTAKWVTRIYYPIY